ncbi:MAG: metal ABC transporter permease [Tissierellia bacterium]|nr:metal ABC transporter permease [Tissierellia bacterium]
MVNIFQYDFMIRAFIVGSILAIIIPLIGVIVVLKRLSMMGDALSHSSLTGVAAGLAFGFNPVLGAVFATLLASLSIEAIRKKFPEYSEMSIAIIMSAGIGLAGILSGFVKNSTGFNSFLFGSIVAITDFELIFVICTALIVLTSLILLHKELFFIAIDERGANLQGVPVKTTNFIFTVLTAITVSIAARTVGTLIVSSMMVIPVASAMQISKNYRQTCILSVIFAVIGTIVGLVLSFYIGLKPGATIVMTCIIMLIIIIIVKRNRI